MVASRNGALFHHVQLVLRQHNWAFVYLKLQIQNDVDFEKSRLSQCSIGLFGNGEVKIQLFCKIQNICYLVANIFSLTKCLANEEFSTESSIG
jgi:predicted transport protein